MDAVDDLAGSSNVNLSFVQIIIRLVQYLQTKGTGIHAVIYICNHVALVSHIVLYFSQHGACERSRADKSQQDCQKHHRKHGQEQHFPAQAAL